MIRWLALRLLLRALLALDCVSFLVGLGDLAAGRYPAVGCVGVFGGVTAAVVALALVRPGPRPRRSQ